MKRSGIDATSGALLGFVVELEPGVWLCDEVHGDPGRTLVLETATRYMTLSKAEAAMDIAKTYRVWPNHAIRPLYRKPNARNQSKGPLLPRPETVRMANHILNHYAKDSRKDHICLARRLEKWAREFTSNDKDHSCRVSEAKEA
jgi:hypothetical protein